MTLSEIMKNIQAFVIKKQNIDLLVIAHFCQFHLKKSKRLAKLSVVKYRLRTKIFKESEFTFDVLTKFSK